MSLTWEEFVATHAKAVLTAALRVLSNPADADEVAQEVFIEVFRAGTFTQLHQQGALLRTMATRRALDRLRRRKPSVALTGAEPSRSALEPSQYAIADELEQRLHAALRELPAREAEVFCLIYFEGYSQTDVARAVGISPGAVAKSLCKARQRLSASIRQTTSRAQP